MKTLKKTLLLITSVLLITASAKAQWGLRTFYNINEAPAWDQHISQLTGAEANLLIPSISLAVDYWTRLNSWRIELYPMLNYHRATGAHVIASSETLRPTIQQIGIGMMSHIYIADLQGDCDCPTFSKQGSFFSKGFFLLAGLGFDYTTLKLRQTTQSSIKPSLSIGAGLDIGLSDLITLTPILQYQYHLSQSWSVLNDIPSSHRRLMIGLRLGIRVDR